MEMTKYYRVTNLLISKTNLLKRFKNQLPLLNNSLKCRTQTNKVMYL